MELTLQDAERRDLHLLNTYCVPGTELAHFILSHPIPSPHHLLESPFPPYSAEKGRRGAGNGQRDCSSQPCERERLKQGD